MLAPREQRISSPKGFLISQYGFACLHVCASFFGGVGRSACALAVSVRDCALEPQLCESRTMTETLALALLPTVEADGSGEVRSVDGPAPVSPSGRFFLLCATRCASLHSTVYVFQVCAGAQSGLAIGRGAGVDSEHDEGAASGPFDDRTKDLAPQGERPAPQSRALGGQQSCVVKVGRSLCVVLGVPKSSSSAKRGA
jgi:hypothetical protein